MKERINEWTNKRSNDQTDEQKYDMIIHNNIFIYNFKIYYETTNTNKQMNE
jgi:hypothetical protein